MPNEASPLNRIHVLEVVGNAIVGGMETCVARLIERLPPERFAVTMLCPFDSHLADRVRGLGVEVIVTPMPESPTWSSIQLAHALVKAHAIDVLHAHLPNAHLLAGLVGKMAGRPVFTTIHGRQLAPADLEMHRMGGTQISVVCQQTYYHALGLGVNSAQLHFIPNGVDVQAFVPRPCRNGELRRRLGVCADTPLVGQVGRLSPEKGPEVFVRAALAVKQAWPAARFVLIGDGPMRTELQGIVERYGMGDAVYLAGEAADMHQCWNELDIAVLASHSEAMPLALMEAMACGLPVVATRVGGVPDIVQQGTTGWVVSPGDFDALAARLLVLLGAAELRAQMGARARERIVERFALDDSVAATASLMTRLVQRPVDGRRVSAVPSNGGKSTLNSLATR